MIDLAPLGVFGAGGIAVFAVATALQYHEASSRPPAPPPKPLLAYESTLLPAARHCSISQNTRHANGDITISCDK